MDTITKEERSLLMSKIRSKNTKPEKVVRQVLTSLGLRYRLHVNKLAGKPDITINRLKIAIFVNGCFWHQHEGCLISKIPKSNVDYWKRKLERNIERQKEAIALLNTQGYTTLIYWECETEKPELLKVKIKEDLAYEK
jgi:DNA mismatch endonuclease (patch repair protein)